jgi:hypothetical protein
MTTRSIALVLACAVCVLGHAWILNAQLPTPPKGPTPIKLNPPVAATPAPPPILTILEPATLYPYQKVSLRMRIDHYPFEDLDRNRLPLHMGDFKRISSITYAAPQPQREKDGSVTFSAIGYFPGTSSNVRIRAAGLSTKKSDTAEVDVSARATLSDRKTYTVTNTWSLKDRFAPTLVHFGTGSFCDGKPPIGSALGVVEHGGKLSFLGRSGPLGTSCIFVLKEFFERNGIVGATWKVEKAGPGEPCKANAGSAFNTTRGMAVIGEDGTASGGLTLLSDERDVATSDGVVFAHDNTDPVSVLKPAMVQYSCPITLGTDVRTIRFILDDVSLLAPPGRSFP